MDKMTLFASMAMGIDCHFHDGIVGRIQSISLESGFTRPNQPYRFNVEILIISHPTMKSGEVTSLYVRTTS